MLHLLDESKHVSFGSAAEAHVPTSFVVDTERRRTFGMERTETYLATASTAKLRIWRHHVRQSDRGPDLLNVVLSNAHDTTLVPRERTYDCTVDVERSEATIETVRIMAMTDKFVCQW